MTYGVNMINLIPGKIALKFDKFRKFECEILLKLILTNFDAETRYINF